MMVRTVSARTVLRRFVGVVAGAAIVVAGAVAQEQDAIPDPQQASAKIGALANRGRTERARGEIDASIATFESAREVAEAAKDRRSSVFLDSEIVTSLSQAGRYKDAVEILRSVEERLEEFADDPGFLEAVRVYVRADLARGLQKLGRLREALESAQQAVEDASSTEDPAARGSAYDALGNTLLYLGRPAAARPWLQQAIDEFEVLAPTDARRTTARTVLAQCEAELGDTESALEIANQLVDEFESFGSEPVALGAEIYELRGQMRFYRDWDGSELDLRRSLEFLGNAGTEENSVRFQELTLDLAHAIRNAGRPDESATLERRTLAELREKHLETHPTAIRAAQFLAVSLRDLWDRDRDRHLLDESRALLEEAARTAREVDDPNTAEVFALLGELLFEGFDDPDRAEPWLRAAVERIEHEASGALALDERSRAELLQRRRLRKRHDPYELLLRCLIRLDRPEQALDVLEHSRARSLADLLERSRSDPTRIALDRAEASGNAKTADRLRRLPDELDVAVANLARARMNVDSDTARAELQRDRERVRELEDERASLTRDVSVVGNVATVAEVRSHLGKDEILLAYFLGRKVSYACLAESLPGRVEWFPLPGGDGRALTFDEVDSRSRQWADVLGRGLGDPSRGLTPSGSPTERGQNTTLGSRLFQGLVPPALWERIRGRTVIHLLPHGPLNRLPFEALVVESPSDGGEPKYWLDVGPAIAYQESGSAFVWSQRRRREQEISAGDGEALIVADPVYGGIEAQPDALGNGPVIVKVKLDGQGARQGLTVGDRIVSIAGEKTGSVEECQRILGRIQDMESVACVVSCRGVERSIQLSKGDAGWEIADGLPSELKRGSNRGASTQLERLPGTGREAHAVEDALRQRSHVRLLTGTDATETLLTAWSPRAQLLHLAAHQIPDPADGTGSSRLALAPPTYPTAEDDGYLDLDDLMLHWRGRLDRCGLVVLSSCWSRGGRLMRDEGFFGLPLGLRYAGCPSIVSSLWPVDDDATAELMSAFYGFMAEPQCSSRLVALQRAKKSLKMQRPDPYYWAAFLWTGSTR